MKHDFWFQAALGMFVAIAIACLSFGSFMLGDPSGVREFYRVTEASPSAMSLVLLVTLLMGVVLLLGVRRGALRPWFIAMGWLAVLKGALVVVPDVTAWLGEWWMAQSDIVIMGTGLFDLVLGLLMLGVCFKATSASFPRHALQ
jgi:hypothetical protein